MTSFPVLLGRYFQSPARLFMVTVTVNSTAVVMQSFFPSQSKTYITRQPRSRDPFLSLSLSLSLSLFLSFFFSFFNCTATMFWISWLESDSLFDESGMVKWDEQNYTRVSVPTKTNSKMKLFHEKLPLRVTKETARSQKKKNGEVPSLKPKETGDCVKCKRFFVGPVTTRVVIAL